MKKRTFMHTAAALALASALPVAHAQSTPIKFQLDWRFEGPAALFLQPVAKGYFKAAGLDVTVDAGNGPGGAVQRVGIERRHRAGRQQRDRGAPCPALAPPESVREQQQQHTRAQRERRREGPEGPGQHLGEGVHTAVPEAREDPGGDVKEPDEGDSPADQAGNGLGARAAQYAPRPA